MLKEQKQAFQEKDYGLLAGVVRWEELLDNNTNQAVEKLYH